MVIWSSKIGGFELEIWSIGAEKYVDLSSKFGQLELKNRSKSMLGRMNREIIRESSDWNTHRDQWTSKYFEQFRGFLNLDIFPSTYRVVQGAGIKDVTYTVLAARAMTFTEISIHNQVHIIFNVFTQVFDRCNKFVIFIK